MKVYKYRGGDDSVFKRDLESMRKNYFWSPKFKDLNDPCEGLFNSVKDDLNTKVFKELLGNSVEKGIDAYTGLLNVHKEFGGIFSLSKTNTDEILWAHYGASHTGFCIEYDLEKLKNDYGGYETFGFDVEYHSTPPEVTFADAFSTKKDKLTKIKKVFGQKSSRWAYEEEYRMVTDLSGVYPYNFEALTGIYFGLRMKDERKEIIRKTLSGRGISFYQMVLKENSYEFDYELLEEGIKNEITYQRIIPNYNIDGESIYYKIEKDFIRPQSIGHVKFKLDKILNDEGIKLLCDLVQDEIFHFAQEIKIQFFEDGNFVYFAESKYKNNSWTTELNPAFSGKENYNIDDYRIFPNLTLEEKFMLEASRLNAGGRVKAKLVNGIANINYIVDYEEYKQFQPQSAVTKEQFDIYWTSEKAVFKVINDGGVRLMRKIDQINEVIIKIPYNENVYSVNVKKNELEDYLGCTFKEIRLDWDDAFSNKYVHSKEGRREFFKKFGKIEKHELAS